MDYESVQKEQTDFLKSISKVGLLSFIKSPDNPTRISFLPKVLKCLNQCFARLQSWKSVSSKTAVDPSSRFPEFETLNWGHSQTTWTKF